jgi:hypothetical protein
VPRSPSRTREAIRLPLVLLVLPWTFSGGASAATGGPRATVDASALVRAIEAGRPVLLHDVDIRGDVRLPPSVGVPVIARDVNFLDDVLAAHTSFSRVVDLSGSVIAGVADFAGARFDAPFVFERGETKGGGSFALGVFRESARFGRAILGGRVDFSGAQLHGEARFDDSSFTDEADFSLAGFDGVASFVSTSFDGEATFTGSEFGSIADFTASSFSAAARFDGVRFAAPAVFINTDFSGDQDDGTSVDFTRATFEDDATFAIINVFGNAIFILATSSAGLDFHGATFRGGGRAKEVERSVLNFSTARLVGTVSFAEAHLAGPVNFDQAFVGELDLRDAEVEGSLQLPLGPRSGGRLQTLRLDLEDAERVDGPGDDDGPSQQAALALVESSARTDEDLETANDARLRRLTMARHRKGPVAESLDFSLNYGIWGYGVRPFHQLLAIISVIIVGTGIRWRRRRAQRPTWSERLRGAVKDLGNSFGTLLRLHPPTGGWSVFEYLVFKLLTVAFVLNAANVWPVSRELIEGVF